MDKVIKEGTLRLQINESTCDIILSCNGHRLLAHKLILSIASPVFKKLLKQDADTTSVIILPDISGNTMSLILDYIYTGRTVLYPNSVQEFLSVTQFLQIQVDLSSVHEIDGIKKINIPDMACVKKLECSDVKEPRVDQIEHDFSEARLKKPKLPRKLPDLLPIRSRLAKSTNKKLGNFVVPSPWKPREEGQFLGDPRIIPLEITENDVMPKAMSKTPTEDKNNNSHVTPNSEIKSSSKKLDDIIRNLYLNNAENTKERASNKANDNANSLKRDVINEPSIKDTNQTSANEKNTNKNHKTCEIPKFSFLRRFIQMTSEHSTNNNDTEPSNILSEASDNNNLSKKPKIIEHSPMDDIKTESVPADGNAKQITDIENEPSSSSNDISNDNSTDSCGDGEKKEDAAMKKKPFKCEECGKCFSQLRNYKYHRSVHEGTKEFSAKCQECGKTFNDRGYLSSHMKIHRDKKEYACPNCPKRFNQRVAYNMHLRIHTGVKPHECPTCGKSFSRKMLLKQHQRVHTGERPYSCPECGKTFADRSNMSLHARLHTGVKPYACSLCPKSFTKKHHLKTHMNFHTGLKPYTCDNCGLAFSQSSNMRTHYKKCILKESKPSTKEPANSLENSS
ncbi:uncharacterized protein LOC143202626 [Rhynchophorus ferrugineus]|uniref:uncharacterized protein LOC143202626 n=1 Tax=Rhynchophorus ferrugineus TaxID=354439 RepID=UPI003FCDD5AF